MVVDLATRELLMMVVVVVELGSLVVSLGTGDVEVNDEEEEFLWFLASGLGTFTFRRRYLFCGFCGPMETTRLVTEVVTTRPGEAVSLLLVLLEEPAVDVIRIGSAVTTDPCPAPEAVTFFSE